MNTHLFIYIYINEKLFLVLYIYIYKPSHSEEIVQASVINQRTNLASINDIIEKGEFFSEITILLIEALFNATLL